MFIFFIGSNNNNTFVILLKIIIVDVVFILSDQLLILLIIIVIIIVVINVVVYFLLLDKILRLVIRSNKKNLNIYGLLRSLKKIPGKDPCREHSGIFIYLFVKYPYPVCNLFIELLFYFIQIDLRDDPKTLARLLQMKEKPLTYEQGLKLAREVMGFSYFRWFGLVVICS